MVTHEKQSTVVPLVHGGDRLFVKVRVNDQDLGWWLLDTGEAGIVIDAAVAQRLELPVVSKIWGAGRDDPDASLVLLGKLQVGPAPAVRHLAIATDLTHWRAPVDVAISGILGWAFLHDRPFSIDCRAGTLTLFEPGSLPIPDKPACVAMLRFPAGVPEIQGDIGGVDFGWFRIASGEEFPLVLEPWFPAVHPEINLPLPPRGDLPEYEQTWSGQFGPLHVLGKTRTVAGLLWTNASMKLPPRQYKLSIAHVGAPFFRGMRLTFDPANSRIWAEQRPNESAEAMLARFGGPNARDLAGVTPLMQAAIEMRGDVVAALIERGADVNTVDAHEHTALMRACDAGNAPTVKALLAHGANPDAAEMAGHTALAYAAVRGNVECVNALLAAGAKPDPPISRGFTPLYWASAAGRDNVVEILCRHGARQDLSAPDDRNPPLAAAALADVKALRALLKVGAPAPESKTGRTPLMEAAANNAIAAARFLIGSGSDVNARALDGKTALMEAADCGATEIVRLLLAAGADPGLRSADGKDAFNYAMLSQQKYCTLLLYAAAHPRIPAASSRTMRADRIVFPVQRAGPYLCLPASIDGHPPVPMILDTGAIGLLIDKSLVEKLHLRRLVTQNVYGGSEKTTQADVVEVPTLQIGKYSVGPALAFAVDLSGLGRLMGLKVPPVVGMPFINSMIRIDFPAAQVEVDDPQTFRPPRDATEIPLSTIESALCVPAILFGGDHVVLALDSGDGNDFAQLHLNGPYSLLHEKGRPFNFQYSMNIAGSTYLAMYRLRAVEMLGHRFSGTIALAPNSLSTEISAGPPGWITADMLQRCSLWLDLPGGRAWAKWLPDNEPLDAFIQRVDEQKKSDLFNTTPLMRAVKAGRADAVAALLKRGAKPDGADTTGWTALEVACSRGDQAIADLLLENHAAATNAELSAAAAHGMTEVVKRLIQSEALRKNRTGLLAALHEAVISDSRQCVDCLLSAGADPNGPNPDARTPLIVAGGWGCPSAAEALLNQGANLEASLSNGQRALMSACEFNHLSTSAVFLTHGAQLNAADHDGKTALMYAAANPDFGLVQQRLKAGANPRVVDRNGGTALDTASEAKVFSNAEAIYFATDRRR